MRLSFPKFIVFNSSFSIPLKTSIIQICCRICYCLILYIGFTNDLVAQEYLFYNYNVDAGLPSSEAYTVFQDSQGYIWVGTDEGVSRFDGYQFKNYGINDGLLDVTVFNILEDAQGRVWFATMSCKLFYFENGQIYSYKHNDKILQELKKVAYQPRCPLAFTITNNNIICYTVSTLGSFYISTETLAIRDHDFSNKITDLVWDELGEPIVRLNYSSGNLKVKTKEEAEVIIKKKPSKYANLTRKHVWLNDHVFFNQPANYLYAYDTITTRIRDQRANGAIISLATFQNRLLVNTDRKGIQVFDSQLKELSNDLFNALDRESVTHVLKDREGSYWFSTLDSGVFYLPNLYFTYIPHDYEVNALTKDAKGSVYYGLEGGDVYKINNGDSIRSKLFISNNDSRITSMCYDESSKGLWIGRIGGVWVGEEKTSIDAHGVKNMFTQNGQLMLRGITKVFRRKEGTINDFVADTLYNAKDRIYATYLLNEEQLLVAKREHLIGYNVKSKTSFKITDSTEILNVRVNQIKRLNDDLVLLATRGKGLLLYGNGYISKLGKVDGLCSNSINDIAVQNDHTVWVSTNHGINRIIFEKNKALDIITLNRKHGLVANEVNALLYANSKLYLGTKKGLGIVDTENLGLNSNPVTLNLGHMLVNEQEVANNKNEFEYDENYIAFNYSGINFKQQGSIWYRYRLKGVEETWHQTMIRHVRYPKLSYGNYTFEVCAQDENGIWGQPKVRSFQINKPFWLQAWFIISTTLLLVITIVYAIRRKLKALKKEAYLKQELIHLERKALQAQMNPHFIFNSLTSLQGFITQKQTEEAQNYLVCFARLIRTTLNHSTLSYVSLKEELELIRNYVYLEQMRFPDSFEFVIDKNQSLNDDEVEIPPMIIQPFVENAIQHGILKLKRRGKIDLEIKKAADELLTIIITDNGVGRKNAVKHELKQNEESKGIIMIEERLKLLDSKNSVSIIDLVNEQDESIGTQVLITIKYFEFE